MLSRIDRCSSDVSAQAFLGNLGDVLSVDQDAAGLDLVKPQQQVDQGRLPGARPPDQTDPFAGCDRKVDAMKDTPCGAMAEAHPLEADRSARDLQSHSVGPVR